MRAVVLERNGNRCIVLADDGCVYKIHASFDAGEEIDVSTYLAYEKRTKSVIRRSVAAAAVFVIALFGAFCYSTFDVSAAVTTGGDAPITYYVNHRGHVLEAEAENDEGRQLLKKIDIEGHPPIDKVLKKTEGKMREEGFLEKDEKMTYEKMPPKEARERHKENEKARKPAAGPEKPAGTDVDKKPPQKKDKKPPEEKSKKPSEKKSEKPSEKKSKKPSEKKSKKPSEKKSEKPESNTEQKQSQETTSPSEQEDNQQPEEVQVQEEEVQVQGEEVQIEQAGVE